MEILVEGCAERRIHPELGELRLGLEHEGDDREIVVDLTSDLARRFSEAVAPLRPRAVVSWGLEPGASHVLETDPGDGTESGG